MKSFNMPTSNEVDAALPLLSSPQHEAYFFSRLQNSKWIGPLAEREVFKYPPNAIAAEEGGFRFPSWPQSRYLARMAGEASVEVSGILSKIETDNASIVSDIVDAALAMPPNLAAQLVPVICKAARSGLLWILFKDESDLCVRLAEGGEANAARELADALFTPTFDHGREEPRRRDAHWYKEGLRKVVPALAKVRSREILPKCCEWLKASVEAMRYFNPKSTSDFSYIWRPAIEEHEANHDYEFAAEMTGIVRSGFEAAIRSSNLSLEDALNLLGRFEYLIYRRIRLHLICEFGEQCGGLVRQTILNRELFDDYECRHEYARLVGSRFNLLSGHDQEEWFSWVDVGLALSELGARDSSESDPEAAEDERTARIEYWQFVRLHWVRSHLAGARLNCYRQMLAKLGEPELADLVFRSRAGHCGDESPMTIDELTAMSFEQAVVAVSSWTTTERRFEGPNLKGLASNFGQYLATNSEGFSGKARTLIERPPIFVRTFVSQMSEAIKAGREVEVPSVLDLCEWVIGQPANDGDDASDDHDGLVDTNWQWTRGAITQLIENICTAKKNELPKFPLEGLRDRLWRLLENLSRDRTASGISDSHSEDDPRIRDFLLYGINSPRGKAVEAALEYARWVANHIKQHDGEKEIVQGGFDSIPEVREMLEWQLLSQNRSVEVMSVIGSRFGLLYWIDSKWLSETAVPCLHLEGIEQTPPVAEGWAAWNAFLVWVPAHFDFYRILKSQFSYAVAQTATVKSAQRGREQPIFHLGQHLMLLYGRGQLGLDDDGGLLRRFIQTADSEIRRHAFSFVGRSLGGAENVPGDILERFMTLWDYYWKGPGTADAREVPNAWLFGEWFACGKFPTLWVLDRLAEFVEVAPNPEPDDAVVEKLAEISNFNILKTVQILDRMIRGDQEGWRIHGWLDSAKAILNDALMTPGEPSEEAVALINYLGRRGYMEFGQLLDRTQLKGAD